MLSEVFTVPFGNKTVHEMRRTLEGVQHLKETGRYKDYMYLYDRSNKPFLSWDGEGWSDINNEHSYMLLMNSAGNSISAPRLDTWEILEFILSQGAQYQNYIHVIYGGGYDVTHWLRDLPLEDRVKLKETNKLTLIPPSNNRNKYYIEYIPHKWFEITGWDWNLRKKVTVKIYDVMTFFQSSAIAAWESRGIPIPDEIRSGKASRADFSYDDLEEIMRYCQLELEMLVVLANKLREEFKEAFLNVSEWHGPGAVATAVFKKYKIKDHKQEPSLKIERLLQHAYFGGRFEQFKLGHHPGKVYVYDINSAYPSHIRNLPSLANARWKHTNEFRGNLGIYLCRFDNENDVDTLPYPLPWRGKQGRVAFPRKNKAVWVWNFEAQFATEVVEGYELIPATDAKPFSFIDDMFQTRRQWKAEGRGGERALKLAMNSLYGKTAQRIAADNKRPVWHQLEWAGMITSATRAQIWEAVQQSPENIIAIETDSVASTVPLDLDMGTDLGQWEYTEYESMTYIQSGVYFAGDEAHGRKVRSRGIDVRQLNYEQVMQKLAHPEDTDPITVEAREFIGITNLNRDWMYGQWNDTIKEIQFAGGKRIHVPYFCPQCDAGLGMHEAMHELIATPTMGVTPSAPHPLPWLDGPITEDTPETQRTTTEAIAQYDTPRHT